MGDEGCEINADDEVQIVRFIIRKLIYCLEELVKLNVWTSVVSFKDCVCEII